jgi:hypothetical protein
LNKGVYFFIDKDFDGLKGYDKGPDVYVTETYSFENALVTSEVLREILTVDMHCHSAPQIRDAVVEKFEEVYSSFLDVTRAHNHRIYLARRLGIDSKPLPDKLNRLATVSLLKVDSRTRALMRRSYLTVNRVSRKLISMMQIFVR